MAFKPIDPKRDEYRRYLERGGIIESLTKVFVRILKERPEDPTQYLLQNLGDARLQADNIAYLQSELDDARSEIQRLREIIRGINPDLLNDIAINESMANDNINESVTTKFEQELPPPPPPAEANIDQNHQQSSAGEYADVVKLEEGLQNTHISDAIIQSTETDVQNENNVNAE